MLKDQRNNSFDFLLNKNQFQNKKLYACIECQGTKYDTCDFVLKLNSKSVGIPFNFDETEEEIKEKQENIVNPTQINKNSEGKLTATTTSFDLYTLEYTDCLTLPSSYKTYHQIPWKQGAKCTVQGSSVTCSESGLILPKNETWYWYGGMGTTAKPAEGQVPTSIEISYTMGTSTVTVTEGGVATQIFQVTVVDYATVYAYDLVDKFIAANITNSGLSTLDKLKKITQYPAFFKYDYRNSGMISMIACGGGDCWASTSTINYICEKVGIKSHLRYAANDGGAGSGHRNVAALVGKDVYICEAGYGYEYAPRPYHVVQENQGWCYSTNNKQASIRQYDGFDNDLIVPSEIEGYPVIGIGDHCFYYGVKYSKVDLNSVKLPDSITTIDDSAFNSITTIKTLDIPKNVEHIGDFVFPGMSALTAINVHKDNRNYTSQDGVLYSKNMTILYFYPNAKKENYTGPESLKTMNNYSFYDCQKVLKVIIPPYVTYMGEGVFAQSTVKEVYFAGDPPKFGDYIFYRCTLTAYYPKGNNKWTNSQKKAFNATKIEWVEWDPSEVFKKEEEEHGTGQEEGGKEEGGKEEGGKEEGGKEEGGKEEGGEGDEEGGEKQESGKGGIMDKINDIKNFALKHIKEVSICAVAFVLLIALIICIKCRKRNKSDELEANVKSLTDARLLL